MKVVAGLSTVAIVSFFGIAPSLALTSFFENSANQSLSSQTQPTLVSGIFDQVVNTTNRAIRTQNQQQNQLNRQQRRQKAGLARQQRLEQYRQRRLERQATAKARQEQERRYFESLTPEKQKQYIAKKKAQQDAQAKALLTIFGAAMSSGGNSSGGQQQPEYDVYEQAPSASQSSPTVYKDTGFYGNCHGGSFYGC